jgi:hypothetical protein
MRSFFFLLFAGIVVAAAAQSPPRSQAISATEARDFGQEIEREFRENGPDFLVKAIDLRRLLEIAIAGQPGKEEYNTGFRQGLMSKGLGANLAKGMEGFSSYKLLRVITTNERPLLVFRGLTGEGALNYHILELERSRGPDIRVVDLFFMLSGEKVSETLRRLYLVAAAEADRSLLSRLTQGQGVWVKHSKDVQAFIGVARNGDSKAALKLYQSLPEPIRAEKSILVMRLVAAAKEEDGAYLSAIEAFEKHFPNDPSLALVSIDGFVLKKQPRKVITSLEKLDRFIGGDPYLLLLQAGQYLELKDKRKTRELAGKAIEQEPSLSNSYDFLLGLSLEDKDFAETIRVLDLAEKNLKIDMLKAVQNAKEYKSFLESPAGKKWKADHRPQ